MIFSLDTSRLIRRTEHGQAIISDFVIRKDAQTTDCQRKYDMLIQYSTSLDSKSKQTARTRGNDFVEMTSKRSHTVGLQYY